MGDTAKDALLKAENSFGLVDNPFTFTNSFFGNLKLPILTFSNLKDTFRKLQKNVLMHRPSTKKSLFYPRSSKEGSRMEILDLGAKIGDLNCTTEDQRWMFGP